MANLNFLRTQTIEQFKAEMLVDEIKVRVNPHTGKLFFTFGAATGAVSLKGIPEHPMISKVSNEEGETFYLLHEEGNGGAKVVATF